jgi:hypothetical protein
MAENKSLGIIDAYKIAWGFTKDNRTLLFASVKPI